MSALSPGLYRATVRGVADQIVMVHDDGTAMTMTRVNERSFHPSDQITDARPLIVLDLAGYSIPTFVRRLREAGFATIPDQIEAQTKPPRIIPEPGLWGVVEASVPFNGRRTHYLHDDTKPGAAVWSSVLGRVAWDNLIDPTLIRAGVTE